MIKDMTTDISHDALNVQVTADAMISAIELLEMTLPRLEDINPSALQIIDVEHGTLDDRETSRRLNDAVTDIRDALIDVRALRTRLDQAATTLRHTYPRANTPGHA